MLLWFFNLAVFSCHFFLAPFLALFLVHVPCCCFLLHYLLPVLAHVFVHLLTFVIFVSLRWLSPTHIRRQTNGLPLRRSKLHVFTSFFLVLSLPMYFLIRTLVLSLLISSFIIFLKSLPHPSCSCSSKNLRLIHAHFITLVLNNLRRRRRSGSNGLSAGSSSIWLCVVSSGFNIDSFTMADASSSSPLPSPTPSPTPSPGEINDAYEGDPIGITSSSDVPGTVEAEDFDDGGEGVGYSDTTSSNLGGVSGSTDSSYSDPDPDSERYSDSELSFRFRY